MIIRVRRFNSGSTVAPIRSMDPVERLLIGIAIGVLVVVGGVVVGVAMVVLGGRP